MSRWGILERDGLHYDLHSGQAQAMRSGARFVAAIAGTGGGKTAIGPLWCLNEIAKACRQRDTRREPIVGMIAAPTYKLMRKATAAETCRVFDRALPGYRYVESRACLELPNNLGVIWMLTADNPQHIEGGQADFAWLDEAGQMKYGAWIAAIGRVGVRQGRILITTTPYGLNWLKTQFCDRAIAGDNDYAVATWESIRNPVYPKEVFEHARRVLSPHRFAMRYRGEFLQPMGLVYPDLMTCVCHYDSVPSDSLLFGGIDYGWSPSPFAALGAALDQSDVLWLCYKRYIREQTVEEHGKAMPRGVCWAADPESPESIAVLRQQGHDVRPNKVRSVATGIDMVCARIRTGRLKIRDQGFEELLQEGNDYRYPEKDDQVIAAEPVGEHHALDALRYMIAMIDRKSSIFTGDDDSGEDAPENN